MRTKLMPIFVSHEVGAGFLPDVPRAEQPHLRPDAHRQIADAVVALCAASHARGNLRTWSYRRARPR